MEFRGYRYGFNGKENDNEVKGEGNQQDYGMRIYDPRLGKFLSVDPITKSYPELTPYQFASNSPIANIDLDGLEAASPENLRRTRSILEDAMDGWFTSDNYLLRASEASVNARPNVWWQHAHRFANNGGNRTWNKLKGVAGEAIAARIAYNNFARDLSTMNIVGDKFQWFNGPTEDEGPPGGTFDYMLTASFNRSNMNPGTELPEWHLTLFNASGQLTSEHTYDLSSPRKFLFEIKTLSPSSSNLSNIVKGFKQAIANAELNPSAYSILMIDKQAYLNTVVNPGAAKTIGALHATLEKLNGGLWLVDDLEKRANDKAYEAYKEIKSQTTNETATTH